MVVRKSKQGPFSGFDYILTWLFLNVFPSLTCKRRHKVRAEGLFWRSEKASLEMMLPILEKKIIPSTWTVQLTWLMLLRTTGHCFVIKIFALFLSLSHLPSLKWFKTVKYGYEEKEMSFLEFLVWDDFWGGTESSEMDTHFSCLSGYILWSDRTNSKSQLHPSCSVSQETILIFLIFLFPSH